MRRMLNGIASQWPGVIEMAVHSMDTSWHSSIETSLEVLARGVDRSRTLLAEEERTNAWRRAIVKQRK